MDLAPQPTIINKEKKYKVEEVRKHRKQEQRTQYLVHQKDYEDEHDQQIVEKGLPHAREVIEEYWTKILS